VRYEIDQLQLILNINKIFS